MKRIGAVPLLALAFVVSAAPAHAVEPPCDLEPRTKCFGLESVEASLSTAKAGDHPDITLTFDIRKDPDSDPNSFGLKDAFAPTRSVRIESPPGLIGDPNVLGIPQQCTAEELATASQPGGGCPNGSQIGVARIFAYELSDSLLEPIYMMQPPGGDVVARLGLVAGTFPTYIDARVRTESDYGLTLEFSEAPTLVKLIRSESTLWGVPAAKSHDNERCTPAEVINGCEVSESRPPGSRPLPFLTNPTRCAVPLEMRVSAASWAEPDRFDSMSAAFPQISECNRLPYGPGLSVEPTNHRAGAPTGLDMTIQLPASEGVNVLEPSQTRYIRIDLPEGLTINTGSADGLATCSVEQVRFEKQEEASCPDASKLADTEFDIPVLSRRMKGAIYLREPEPGNPFRIWIVADDLGAHVKLPGQLEVDKETGQIHSIVLGTPRLEGMPQAPLREVKLEFKSGFRAPLVNPSACGTFLTQYEFVPWSGGPPAKGSTPMTINEGCSGLGGFSPTLSAGTIDSDAGKHSPFLFTLKREDSEQNPARLDISLPKGFAATFAGVPRCEGGAAETGACPASSRIGKVIAAVGAGQAPLWVPQPGSRPTAVYLSGPYKGAPLSIVAVVPRQAGPFDFGDEVVRSAVFVDPTSARATAKADPLPQFIEGIPIRYRTLHVDLDRPGFTLNPTGCMAKATEGTITSVGGVVAKPTAPFRATNCTSLRFKPRIAFHLLGGTRRGAHPKLRAVLQTHSGDANLAGASVALPHSEFLDQNHIKTVCTRVQFAAKQCPAGSVYGHATAVTPLFDFPLQGEAILRSSNHTLPDLVLALHGPPSLPIEVDVVGRIDSVNGGIRTTFETIPDAPVRKFKLEMQGGKRGLLVNSTNLCVKVNRATAKFSAQSGKSVNLRPPMKVSCAGKSPGTRTG
jgi:hypothetical protein